MSWLCSLRIECSLRASRLSPALNCEQALNKDEVKAVAGFSVAPKNGPRDFAGVWDKGGIRFARDGNFWTKM